LLFSDVLRIILRLINISLIGWRCAREKAPVCPEIEHNRAFQEAENARGSAWKAKKAGCPVRDGSLLLEFMSLLTTS
jgi:hypothetical protein